MISIQGAANVVAVDAKVQCKVVARASGDDDEGDTVLARDRGDECLRAIPASHPEQVGTARDGVLGQLAQVVTWVQDDGLDAALPTQVDQPEPLSLAPTGLEVH